MFASIARVTKRFPHLASIKRMASGHLSPLQRSIGAVTLKGKKTLRPALAAGIRQVFQHPQLRARLSQLLKKSPWVHQRLLRMATNVGAIDGGADMVVQLRATAAQPVGKVPNAVPQALTPRARRIYTALKAAIENAKPVQR